MQMSCDQKQKLELDVLNRVSSEAFGDIYLLYLFLVWDQPYAHTAAALFLSSSAGNRQHSFTVTRCLLLPVDGVVPPDPAASSVTDC